MTPNGTTTGQQERSGKKATVATVGVGAIITALYLWAAAFWAFPTALGAALATVALFFVGYMMGIPAYMLGARVLADKEITGNELRAALTWPFEVALVAFTGSKFRGSDGQRTIARQIQREDDNSSTVASGIGAYLIVGISVVLALGLVGTPRARALPASPLTNFQHYNLLSPYPRKRSQPVRAVFIAIYVQMRRPVYPRR